MYLLATAGTTNCGSVESSCELGAGSTPTPSARKSSHLDEENLYFPVSNVAELQAIIRYGGRAGIKIAGDFTVADLINGCREERLTHLWLSADIGDSWKWLKQLPQLRCLTIETPLPHLDLAPLASLVSPRTIHLPTEVVIVGIAPQLPSDFELENRALHNRGRLFLPVSGAAAS